ncbi:alpha/beta-hydrolase [Gloeophyllum trabeum ATCC 11539]|uniref:Alpha/beta-hydrolase n=1 Tax=Gloeophyllum trabeum (strain ATCC 11539 / FP-39264 / Madison 617) TaxID=670483 RepID=S7Q669_GLOTA|nr:alpha/beta-hydrolase [Gloeophyllum trabeum ATCC 11539]EPQ54977.1 alpha/beta-hydrolase [Gloeophyllum trabeum ATCC 11539]
MARVPLIGRLSPREYFALVFGFLFIAFEFVLRITVLFLPTSVVNWFTRHSRSVYHFFFGPPKPKSQHRQISERIRKARDFAELCAIFGYVHEEHIVLTKDGYLLNLHRLPTKKGERRDRPGTSTGKPVVYLHHGLLMNSEVWVCLTDEERALPFVLAEHGFDVWLGNNRGNKYSKKHLYHNSLSPKFWDYSIDEFAWHDIPDSIDYILDAAKEPSLSYIGFSQGTAQAFAALSIHPRLNEKVNVFIALAPAMNPEGLAAPVVDGLMKASPTLMYLFFGRKSILSSATMWQSILYPPIFAKLIDTSLGWLFAWRGHNIAPSQKIAAYAHLYSFTSVKAVVHWFQIMRNAAFQMYDDELLSPVRTSNSGYRPARFPTKNIVTPIVLLWGDRDSLVDINAMLAELPGHTVEKRLHGYEHLDILWGKNVHRDVIPEVLDALKAHCNNPQKLMVNGVKSPPS